MNFKRLTLFIVIVVIILFMFAFNNGKINNSKYWINIDYVNCLTSKLPCECERYSNTILYITLDTNITSKSYGAIVVRSNYNELEQWVIKKQDNNLYKVYEVIADNNSLVGTISITGGELSFIGVTGKKILFANFDGFNSIENIQHLKQNVLLLNKSFLKRGYPTLEKIIGDSLSCDCNKELGGVNMITSDANHKAWLIEQNHDSVFLYRLLNCDEKSVPFKINKEFVNKYKW